MGPTSPHRMLVLAGDDSIARAVRAAFADATVREACDLGEVASLSREQRFDYAFVDVDLLLGLEETGGRRGCLRALRRVTPGTRVVVMTDPERTRDAVDLVREGATDYLTYPATEAGLQHVRDSVERHERYRAEISYLRSHVWDSEPLTEIPCRSAAMTAALYKVRQVAPTRSTVLLTGETGTGKSYMARALHRASTRADRQLVCVHCGAIPDSLLESELFGHERGAFTGAERRRLGKFEIADGGTLFLDEVATISPAMQVKLLHVLQERTFQRVGGDHDVAVDVRIVAATNVDLARLVSEGRFRSDLYFRLNVFPIEVPSLRDRREDILLLVEQLLAGLRAVHGREELELHPSVMAAFMQYAWPGNVRELENLLERAVILETSNLLLPEDFPEELFDDQTVSRIAVDTEVSLAVVRQRAVEQAELLYLKDQLAIHHGRIAATAEAAGISPRQLHKLMTRYGLRKEDFRPGPATTS
jgi:DNA-binding NtrC family response regulator